jgi:predicted deacetylase
VELHDISPISETAFEKMLEYTRSLKVQEPLLLITPKWDGKSKNESLQMISNMAKGLDAHYILHGVTHSASPSLWDRFWYGEKSGAEFKKLDESLAFQFLKEGRTILEKWSASPVLWFCAPRWKLGKGAHSALLRLDFLGYLGKMGYVIFPESYIRIPVLSFDHGLRDFIVKINLRLANHDAKRYLKSGQSFRLALHPRDMDSDVIRGFLEYLREELQSRKWEEASFPEITGMERNDRSGLSVSDS